MAVEPLPQHLRQAGASLLETLDALGLSPEGAGWIFDHDLGEWRYVVASGLVDSEGRKWLYGKLQALFRAGKFPSDFTVLDVFLMSLEHPMYLLLRSFFTGTNFEFHDCALNGSKFDAILYRWLPPAPQMTGLRKKAFENSVKSLSHA